MRHSTLIFVAAAFALLTFSRLALAAWQWQRVRNAGGLLPLMLGGLRIDAHQIAVMAALPAVLSPWFGHFRSPPTRRLVPGQLHPAGLPGNRLARLHSGIRLPPQPPVRRIPEASARGLRHALARLQGRAGRRPGPGGADRLGRAAPVLAGRARRAAQLVADAADQPGDPGRGDPVHPRHAGPPPHEPVLGGLQLRRHAQHAGAELALQRLLCRLQHEEREIRVGRLRQHGRSRDA